MEILNVWNGPDTLECLVVSQEVDKVKLGEIVNACWKAYQVLEDAGLNDRSFVDFLEDCTPCEIYVVSPDDTADLWRD